MCLLPMHVVSACDAASPPVEGARQFKCSTLTDQPTILARSGAGVVQPNLGLAVHLHESASLPGSAGLNGCKSRAKCVRPDLHNNNTEMSVDEIDDRSPRPFSIDWDARAASGAPGMDC